MLKWRWAFPGGRSAGEFGIPACAGSDIEPFKVAAGLFFIGVGMSIDFGTLAGESAGTSAVWHRTAVVGREPVLAYRQNSVVGLPSY